MRRALVIVGKAPVAGLTKTRLVPPLSPEAAADLYRGFLLDSVRLGLNLGWEHVSVVHSQGSGAALEELLPQRICLLEQPGQGLRDALAHAFAWHFAEGFERVVLIGSDSPTLPREPIQQACDALQAYDVSIGPSSDGGYYLLGLREPCPGLFEAIDWSTPRVYAQTWARACLLGLRSHAVPAWYDVDEPADLERLHAELLTLPESATPNTRVAMRVAMRELSVGRGNEQRRSMARALGVRARQPLADGATPPWVDQHHH
jgi:uncharacterized protein